MPTPFPHPVIFVPGIMGSALRDEYPVDPETVWSPLRLLIKAYERITLHPDDRRYELQEPARVAADKVFQLIYGEIIEELRHNLTPQPDQPVPAFPFPFDWRQPLENIESDLAEFIDEVLDRTKLLRHYHDAGFGTKKFPAQVNLVGHSVGGLIMAGYIQANGMDKVNRVVTIATPFRGSLEAVAKTTVGVAALGASPGSSREREAARVTPALYYLLPSFRGAVQAVDDLSDDLFVAKAWQPGVADSLASFIRLYGLDSTNPGQQAVKLLQEMLDHAWRHRTRIEKLQLADSKKWLCIVGVDQTTRVRLKIDKDAANNPRFDLTDGDVTNEWHAADPRQRIFTGDNTVPYLGARAKFIPTEQLVCVTPSDFSFWEFRDRLLEQTGFHSSLPNMNLVHRLIVSHLKEQPFGEIWGRIPPDIPAGVAWDPPIAGLAPR